MNNFEKTSDMYDQPRYGENKLTSTLRDIKQALPKTTKFETAGIKTTKFSVQFNMRESSTEDWVKVDILPAFDNLGDSYENSSKSKFCSLLFVRVLVALQV